MLTCPNRIPRCLNWVGRHEEALEIIQRLHFDPEDLTNSAAHTEYPANQTTSRVRQEKAGYIQVSPTGLKTRTIDHADKMGSQDVPKTILATTQPARRIRLASDRCQRDRELPLPDHFRAWIYRRHAAPHLRRLRDRGHDVHRFCSASPALAAILLAQRPLQWKYVGTSNKAGNVACMVFIYLFIVFY